MCTESLYIVYKLCDTYQFLMGSFNNFYFVHILTCCIKNHRILDRVFSLFNINKGSQHIVFSNNFIGLILLHVILSRIIRY